MEEQNTPRRDPAIRTIMLPKDTNQNGTIFGGIILSHIDLAAAVGARRESSHIKKLATVAMDKIEFIAPVHVGDIVSFYTEKVKIGRTSITVRVEVEVERAAPVTEKVCRVTTAEVTYVSLDPETDKPTPIFPEGE